MQEHVTSFSSSELKARKEREKKKKNQWKNFKDPFYPEETEKTTCAPVLKDGIDGV